MSSACLVCGAPVTVGTLLGGRLCPVCQSAEDDLQPRRLRERWQDALRRGDLDEVTRFARLGVALARMQRRQPRQPRQAP